MWSWTPFSLVLHSVQTSRMDQDPGTALWSHSPLWFMVHLAIPSSGNPRTSSTRISTGTSSTRTSRKGVVVKYDIFFFLDLITYILFGLWVLTLQVAMQISASGEDRKVAESGLWLFFDLVVLIPSYSIAIYSDLTASGFPGYTVWLTIVLTIHGILGDSFILMVARSVWRYHSRIAKGNTNV